MQGGIKARVIAMALAERRLTNLDKVVLTSMVNGAVCVGGKWLFTRDITEWATSIHVRPRGIERTLRKLLSHGYTARLTKPMSHQHKYQVLFGLGDCMDGRQPHESQA